MEKKKWKWTPLIAGCCSGLIESVVTMPFEVIKSSIAVVGSSSSPITKDDGWITHLRRRGPFAGLFAQGLQSTVKVGLRFSVYESITQYLHGQTLFSGFVAGGLEAIVWIAPTERLKVLRIMNHQNEHTRFINSIVVTVKDSGIKGLWRGGTAVFLRNASVVGTRFWVYDEILQRLDSSSSTSPAIAGFLAGAVTTTLSQPLDVLKSNMNASGTRDVHKSNIEMLRMIWKQRGVNGFLAGLPARVIKISLGQAVIFSVYSAMAPKLDAAFAS